MPKILPNSSLREEAILRAAVEMCIGDQTFVAIDTKKDQKRMEKLLRETRDKMLRDDLRYGSLTIHSTLRDGRLWVVVTVSQMQNQVFVKRADGTIEKSDVVYDPERQRKISCMVQDKLPIDEINSNLDSPMTETEIREYITKGRISK